MKNSHLRRRRVPVALALSGVIAAAAVLLMSAAGGAAAAPRSATLAAQPSHVLVTRIAQGNQLPSGMKPNAAFVACQGTTPLVPTGPCPLAPPSDDGSDLGAPSTIPHSSATPRIVTGPTLGSNFVGITDISQRVDTGYHFTPPDQALCVGPAGPWEANGINLGGLPADQSVIVEGVNDGWAIFDTSGNMLFHDNNADLFSDVYSSGDPECTYDPSSGTYFFTEIGAPNHAYYTTNLAVINGNGYGAYSVDTSGGGGYCFPDFPHQGYDTNALYITVNEFCGPAESYGGANIYAISKSQLVDLALPNAVAFSTGVYNFTFRPATGAAGTEYFLASDQNAASANDLQIAWVKNDNRLDTGSGPITFSMTSIPSEPYAEPVDPASTGDDSTCMQEFHTDLGQPDDQTWCSVPEATLNSVDDRLEQVQFSHGLLITSLSTTMTVGADPSVVDGAAWFVVSPKKLKVVKQGYVGATGTNLLMPSVVLSKYVAPLSATSPMSQRMHLVMSFSMTSPTLNPSTGYVTSTSTGNSWSAIHTTGAGSGPHVSFSTFEPDYLRRRWGDYSRIAIDPSNGSVWSAQEYVPDGAAGADTVDNWGTQVWQVSK